MQFCVWQGLFDCHTFSARKGTSNMPWTWSARQTEHRHIQVATLWPFIANAKMTSCQNPKLNKEGIHLDPDLCRTTWRAMEHGHPCSTLFESCSMGCQVANCSPHPAHISATIMVVFVCANKSFCSSGSFPHYFSLYTMLTNIGPFLEGSPTKNDAVFDGFLLPNNLMLKY